MSEKLYAVRVEFEMVVLVDPADETPEEIAKEFAAESLDDMAMYVPREVRKVEDLPMGWRYTAPWGGDPTVTCDEIIARIQPTDRELEEAGQTVLGGIE